MIMLRVFLSSAILLQCIALDLDDAMKTCREKTCKAQLWQYRKDCLLLFIGPQKDTVECNNMYDALYLDCVIPCLKRTKELNAGLE
ncbi:hypothetical protein M514_03293 [Trichuris suis]|uniref:Uncharacterized protein n=1 Tax=Trichuris suis TaxID=68888 RepID=A0A085MF58_9BILA|nr:hypothetical protein M513_03293 [Trichuris suis]KFD70204.1 hypothetical protein M514_03293 [Trichuris suis]